MGIPEIMLQVKDIFIDVLDRKDIVLHSGTTAADYEEWDSLAHIQLVVEIEKHFKIRFMASEIQGFKNVGDMCKIIAMKIPV